MSIPDDAFREAFKPLHIPAHYNDAHTPDDKVIYALAQLGEGTAETVTQKLLETDPSLDADQYKTITVSVLDGLFNKGLIKGIEVQDSTHYNLSKITEANDGDVNPDLLAPGLD